MIATTTIGYKWKVDKFSVNFFKVNVEKEKILSFFFSRERAKKLFVCEDQTGLQIIEESKNNLIANWCLVFEIFQIGGKKNWPQTFKMNERKQKWAKERWREREREELRLSDVNLGILR